MEIALAVTAFIFLAVGFLGSVIPALPGPPLSCIGLLLLQRSGFGGFSSTFLWVWAAITIIVTIMDNILPAVMTKKFGGSKLAVTGSIIGLVIGMIFFAPVGILAGPFLGAFAGELINGKLKEKRDNKNVLVDIVPDQTGNADNAGSVTPNAGNALKSSPIKAALGAFLAFIVGTGAKLVISAMMIYYAVKAVF
ncbi:MAG: DUF456 domain-containing protein [Treponema sp.]|nr:DUF456 domain-containing protein [Treponema sp.]